MPLPQPNDDEAKEEFMSRCMADELMNEEYEDEGQRYAVCETQWQEGKRTMETMTADRERLGQRESVLSVEARSDADGTVLAGYAALFNSASEEMWGFREEIAPGAFSRTLSEGADVRALVDHDPSKILGRTTSKTLTLEEDDRGLKVFIDPPDTTIGRDVVESVRRGDLSQMSFAFRVQAEEWRDEQSEMPKRVLKEVDLFDVSVVTYPAYKDTTVGLRGFVGAIDHDIDLVDAILDDREKLSRETVETLERIAGERRVVRRPRLETRKRILRHLRNRA